MEPSAMASIASLLVAVDRSPAAANRVRLAGALAEKLSARLIGVAAAEEIYFPVYGAGLATQERLLESEESQVAEALEESEALFRQHAVNERVEWRSATCAPGAHVAEQARVADLVILGRRGPEDAHDGRLGVDAGAVLMECGRPVLVVPPLAEKLRAERIVIAWKRTREARRAVFDSLGLLRAADEVMLALVRESEEHWDDYVASAEDVEAYLRGHGVRATKLLRLNRGDTVAETLERAARNENADLMVMGAYGHSRLREWVFGGVTRDLLDGASLCCLMSR
jgi:nucleotide-binding universal stress UspA family protein